MPAPPAVSATTDARRRWREQLRGIAGDLDLTVSARRKTPDAWLVFEPGASGAFALLTHERGDDGVQAWALWLCAAWAP